MRTFPCRTSHKFDGTANGLNVIEFLHNLNTAQDIMNLTRDEFCSMLLRCVSGRVYNLVSECVSYNHDINDIYHSILTLYDTRMTSTEARKQLMAFRAFKNSTLMKVQSNILELASRVASALPPGESRTALFNLEANNCLLRALPSASSTLVHNTYNNLSARLNRLPTYIELTKSLVRYQDTIDFDISQHGQVGNRAWIGINNESRMRKNHNKVFAIQGSYRQNDYPWKIGEDRNANISGKSTRDARGYKKVHVNMVKYENNIGFL